MDDRYKKMIHYLREWNALDIRHTGDKNYLAHIVAVYNDLKKWGCEEDVCLAALAHSVYGTERFQEFTLPLSRRDDVRAQIGERAERLAYLNCAMDRAAFDATVAQVHGPHFMKDRFTGEPAELTDQEFTDLMSLHLCDWLEQVPRSGEWEYRREGYRAIADRLGGVAREAFETVYAASTATF